MNTTPAPNPDAHYQLGPDTLPLGRHGQQQAGTIMPDMMRWLWRDRPVSTDPSDAVEHGFNEPALKGPGGPQS